MHVLPMLCLMSPQIDRLRVVVEIVCDELGLLENVVLTEEGFRGLRAHVVKRVLGLNSLLARFFLNLPFHLGWVVRLLTCYVD